MTIFLKKCKAEPPKGTKTQERQRVGHFAFLPFLPFLLPPRPSIPRAILRAPRSASLNRSKKRRLSFVSASVCSTTTGSRRPTGDLPASCGNCHLFDQDPQGLRAYADFLNRSWVSSRAKDRRRLGLRNSPTIFDAAEAPRLHHDGEFGSLEELVKGTISGRPMGWLSGEESQAFEHARGVILNDGGRRDLSKSIQSRVQRRGRKTQPRRSGRPDSQSRGRLHPHAQHAQRFPIRQIHRSEPVGEQTRAGRRRQDLRPTAGRPDQFARIKGAVKLTNGFDATAFKGLKLFFDARLAIARLATRRRSSPIFIPQQRRQPARLRPRP